MFDHLKGREEEQRGGTPEGVPQLASLAGQADWGTPPPPDAESEAPTFQPGGDESPGAEPFAGPVRPPRLRPMRKGQRLVKKPTGPKLQVSPEQRLLILDTWRRSGLPAADFSALVGIPKHTLYGWKRRFEQEGPAGLMDRPRGGRRGSKLPDLTKRTILMLKESNPDWGCQRISDMLVRGPALPASPTAVARVLKEAGYELEEVPTHPHPDRVRRFERARPNQLWQTDLFTFVLKRQNRRVYLVGFMDDHSRFLTGFGLHASQSAALVLEVLRTAITSYGPPEEILTDNGAQYVTWRGKSAFTKELEKRGIHQVVASPRRPQTQGKIERFWGTLWRECIETAVFLDLADAQRRIGHFIDYYNFQRTHQGLDGLVPADRYFGAGRPNAKPAMRSSTSGTRRHDSASPALRQPDLWASPLGPCGTQRSDLNTAVDRYRQEERTRRGIPDEAVLGGAAQASVDRVAISRALRQHGHLSFTRRLVTPPVRPRGAARIPRRTHGP